MRYGQVQIAVTIEIARHKVSAPLERELGQGLRADVHQRTLEGVAEQPVGSRLASEHEVEVPFDVEVEHRSGLSGRLRQAGVGGRVVEAAIPPPSPEGYELRAVADQVGSAVVVEVGGQQAGDAGRGRPWQGIAASTAA